MSRTTTANRLRYRRSPHLVAYWRRDQLILEHYAGPLQLEAGPLVLDILDRFSQWEPFDTVARQLPHIPQDLLRTLIDTLVDHHVLETSANATETATKPPTNPSPWDTWESWSPAASFFHHSTKDVPFTARDETNKRLKARAVEDPIPPALKPPYRGKRTILPPPRQERDRLPPRFPGVLLSRRTWRRFGRRSLHLDELSTLLGLTWGVQGWMDVDGWGRMALKTSPSGGARHSIEAYVVVRRVDGVSPGVYHYQPAAHELHEVRRLTARSSRAAMVGYLPRQGFYGDASALVLMSAVFPRVQWRYGFARAYRTVLAEAGHHAQTFCLAATWLGLAPFCTMALADSRIERDLGIDGVSESVLYATGVGPRPTGVTWAPWANTAATPVRTANVLGKRRRR